jgi:sulfonate transport system ATP-binding protein
MLATALRRVDTAFDATDAGPADARPYGLAIALQDLSKSFGDNHVLNGIDLQVPAGQFVAIVGRSGCGKSTLLRLLLGLDAPTRGSFAFEDAGTRIDDARVARVMFQEPRLLPWASVLSNVEVGLGKDRGSPGARSRAVAALQAVDLTDKRNAWPAVLSGGQRQRVSLARALVSRPRILALDEPLGALDALTRISMQRLLERVWREQTFTALLVTHDVAEAVTLADRVILIEKGEIALDLRVDLPRPRQRGSAGVASLEGQILHELFRSGDDAR